MKKAAIFVTLMVLIGGVVSAQSLQGRTMYVLTKTAELKASTGFFADTVATLLYGDQVAVIQDAGKWVEIRTAKQPAATGWIQVSSLTTKRIIASGSAPASASADELALAGKGFSEAVEQSYKESVKLDYTEIDRIEAQAVSDEELYEFLTEGRLSTGDQ